MIEVSKFDIQQMFESAASAGLTQRYKKFRHIDARKADDGELITTIIRSEVETQNATTDADVIVMNMTTKSREQYAISADQAAKRYAEVENLTGDWKTYQPIGEVDAFEWTSDSIQFEAPWGELMILHAGDFLCRIPGTVDDVYRIARHEFFETYQ